MPAGPTVYNYGQHRVSFLTCSMGGSTIAWSSRAAAKGPDVELWGATVAGDKFATAPHRLVVLRDGSTVQDPHAGRHWVEFVSYEQLEQTSSAQVWRLMAVNAATGQTVTLAAADTEPLTDQAPLASITDDDKVVWDELLPGGRKVIRIHDLATGRSQTVNLPPQTYPTRPWLTGDKVVFLDGATDPNRQVTSWLFLGGTVTEYDLATGRLTKLSTPPDSQGLAVNGETAAWSISVPDPVRANSHIDQIHLSNLDGRAATIAGYGTNLTLNRQYLVHYDTSNRSMSARSLTTGRTLRLAEPSSPHAALCGATLYYSVPDRDDTGALHAVSLLGLLGP
jgi:hypothetical protein